MILIDEYLRGGGHRWDIWLLKIIVADWLIVASFNEHFLLRCCLEFLKLVLILRYQISTRIFSLVVFCWVEDFQNLMTRSPGSLASRLGVKIIVGKTLGALWRGLIRKSLIIEVVQLARNIGISQLHWSSYLPAEFVLATIPRPRISHPFRLPLHKTQHIWLQPFLIERFLLCVILHSLYGTLNRPELCTVKWVESLQLLVTI